jgi:hypothetical protein
VVNFAIRLWPLLGNTRLFLHSQQLWDAIKNEVAPFDTETMSLIQLQYVYKPEQLRAYPVGESVWIHHNKSLVDGWKVFGSVTQEDFDALEFKRKTYDSVDKEFHWKHSGHS